MAASFKVRPATGLIGGATGDLDNIDGTDLVDKDPFITAIQDDAIYFHILDADSAAAESSPEIIAFDANGGDKRAILAGIVRLPTGSSLPTNPTKGESFLHTPTGRSIYMMYDGSNWQPIMSLGVMTLYVDMTDGTDSITYGTAADASAYATIQYAVDSIPPIVGGNVTININDESYTEDVTIQGKNFSGAYTITLQGTLALQTTATSATVAAGTGATQGTVTKASAFGSYDNMLAYFVTDEEYRLIDSDTSDVLTITSTCPSSTTQNVAVYDWDTQITGQLTIGEKQTGVIVNDIKLIDDGSDYSVWTEIGSYVQFFRCEFYGTTSSAMIRSYGKVEINESYIDGSGTSGSMGWQQLGQNTCRFSASKVYGGGDSMNGIRQQSGFLSFTQGSIIDDCDQTTGGLLCETNGTIQMYSAAADGYPRIRNCTLGIFARTGGQVANTSNNVYTSNGTDEDNDSGTSFGYID